MWVSVKTPRMVGIYNRAGGLDLLVGVKVVKGVRCAISWVLFGKRERDLGESTAIEVIHALDWDSCVWVLS